MDFGNIFANLNPTSIVLMGFAMVFAFGQMLIKREEGATQRDRVSNESVQAILRFAKENNDRLLKTETRIASLEFQLGEKDKRIVELERLLHVKDTEIKDLKAEVEVLRKQVNNAGATSK